MLKIIVVIDSLTNKLYIPRKLIFFIQPYFNPTKLNMANKLGSPPHKKFENRRNGDILVNMGPITRVCFLHFLDTSYI
jgi:hypothetical protein